jgi:hypothetical protein
MARIFAFLWYVVAVVLVLWAALYLAIHAMREPASVAGYGLGFALLVFIIFYGESTEVAVTRLYDKDPDQIPENLRAGFISLHESDPVPYLSGRELLVVVSIVALTLLCDNLSDVARLDARGLTRLARTLGLPEFQWTFSLLFPTFVALWFAQLPPKFIAHENPLSTYQWKLTRTTIRLSTFLGRTFHVQGPSKRIMAFMLWVLRASTGPADPLIPEKLRPSREHYYKMSATLRDGRGLERVHIVMVIGRDGSVSVREDFRFRAFAAGFRSVSQEVSWEAPVRQGATLNVVYCPGDYSESGPAFSGPELNSQGKNSYSVKWAVTLTSDLPIGEHVDLQVAYETEAAATQWRIGETDFFEYRIKRVPTALLIFEVRPAPDAEFLLIDGNVTANTSEDDRINRNEAERVRINAHRKGGYIYTAEYPLFSTDLFFRWEIAPIPHAQDPTTANKLNA